jgi:hypothetical protein
MLSEPQGLRLQRQLASPESHVGEERPIVLIIDDDERIRAALQELMLSVGIDSSCFASTRELLDSGVRIGPGASSLTCECPVQVALISRIISR